MDLGSIASAFVFGALSFASPCVLPLLPGYLSLMSGYSVADLQEGNASVGRMLRVTLLFVAGFTVVFVAVGATATSLSGFLARNQTTTNLIAGWLIVGFGLIILMLAVSNSRHWRSSGVSAPRRSPVAARRMGAAGNGDGVRIRGGRRASARCWEPLSRLPHPRKRWVRGLFCCSVYSMGLGIPFVASGIGMTKLFGSIAFLRRHLRTINVASGVLMIGFGWLFITGGINDLSSWITELFVKLGWDRLAEI